MYSDKEKKEFLGYNELSREVFLNNFLNNKECKGDIMDQALAIEILYSCAKGVHNYYQHKNKTEKIKIRNEYTYRFIAKRLKEYSKPYNIDTEKKMIKSGIFYKDIYTLYNSMNFIPNENVYEVFLSIDDTKNVAGSLLHKKFKNKYFAILYYKYLEYIIKNKKISYIEHKIETYV